MMWFVLSPDTRKNQASYWDTGRLSNQPRATPLTLHSALTALVQGSLIRATQQTQEQRLRKYAIFSSSKPKLKLNILISIISNIRSICHHFLCAKADSAEQFWPLCTSKCERKSRDRNSASIVPSDIIKQVHHETQVSSGALPLPGNTGHPRGLWRGRAAAWNNHLPATNAGASSAHGAKGGSPKAPQPTDTENKYAAVV